jgi:hypothetical protein
VSMKYYKKMNPIDRKLMILKAAKGSALIEGMKKAADECDKEISELLKAQQKKIASTLEVTN